MEPTNTAQTTLADPELFDRHLSGRENLPAWWLERKKEAWKRFLDLPMPNRKNEEWRFANVNAITLDGFSLPEPDPAAEAEALEQSTDFADHAGRLVFVNDRLAAHDPVGEELAARGVIWMPLEQAVAEHPDLLRRHFMAQPIELGSGKFSALHTALCSAGGFLYVPKGVEIEKPLVAFHWTASDQTAVFPHSLVIADPASKVTLIDCHYSTEGQTRNFITGVNDLYAGEGANLAYLGVQKWSRRSLAFQLNSTQAMRDSTVTSLNLNLGGKLARSENHSQAMGEGCRNEMLSLTVANGNQEFDQRTLQTHLAPNTTSDLLYKNALLDEARTLFSGLIRVAHEAQRTDAYQTNRNLLLNPAAEANSLPGLEILANDVKCSHGATTGQIEPEQIFYLAARGIPREVAHELLVFGFLDEVLEKFGRENLAEELRAHIRGKFGRS